MANVIIAFPNIADKGTLSGGSWVSTLPLSFLQDEILGTVARSTNALASSTLIEQTLDKPRGVAVIGFHKHNLSTDAQYRIRAYSAATRLDGEAIYDSGLQDVWPTVYTVGVVEWESDSFWSLKSSSEELASINTALIVKIPSIAAQWWRFEFFDTTNANGYVQIGRLFMALAWQPTRNALLGATLGLRDRSEVQESIGGTTYADRRSVKRVATLSVAAISKDEVMQNAFEIKRQAGNTREVLLVWDADDTINLQRMSFLGRLTDQAPIVMPLPDLWDTQFEIEERV
ncbi:MAG: hypothetical protein ING75_17120 [Rhodocyclaceae bacterium]|nr:hypothetical protein [Rhodocyclaceae bacterium]